MYGYIYKRQHKINGKIYIGQHKHSVPELDQTYRGSGTLLLEAILEDGDDIFTYELLECADTSEELNLLEQHYIQLFDCRIPNGYNIMPGGGQYEIDDTVREYLSYIATEQWKDESYRAQMCKKFSEGHIGKSSGMLGKKFSEEDLERFRSNSLGRRWFNNGVEERFVYDCPEGFQLGRIITDKFDASTGKIWITDHTSELCLQPSDAEVYLTSGWVRGRCVKMQFSQDTRMKMSKNTSGKKNPMYGKHYRNISKEGVKKRVPEERVQEYISLGWNLGW